MPKTDPEIDEIEEKPSKKEKVELVAKSRLDEKEAELQSLRSTLKAIEGAQRPSGPTTPIETQNGLGGFAKIIADEMGWGADAVENVTGYLRVVDRYANTIMQQQLYPVLNGLADKIDGIEARQQYPDFSKYESEIETERQARQARGAYLSRTEAYHLVRGKHLPDILAEEKAKDAETRTPAPADDAAGTARSTQKAGPIGTASTRLPSHDEIASMTPEARKQLLTEMGSF